MKIGQCLGATKNSTLGTDRKTKDGKGIKHPGMCFRALPTLHIAQAVSKERERPTSSNL